MYIQAITIMMTMMMIVIMMIVITGGARVNTNIKSTAVTATTESVIAEMNVLW